MSNKREFICGNCKYFLSFDTTGKQGICEVLAKRKLGVQANRESAGMACYQFDPRKDILPPVPEGDIPWVSLARELPVYGGFILVRYICINQHGQRVGMEYKVLKTPFSGELPPRKVELPEDNFETYVPTHFAYINDVKS